ncbi:sirohydrochlorin cobaltochelatase [Intestinibacillus massiliensis]
MPKKALAVISFGTTYPEARKAIQNLEKQLAAARPEYDFYRAFTSSMVIGKIKREEGITVPTPEELLTRLAAEGYEEVICQSLHVIPGYEYEKMCAQITAFTGSFSRLEIGKPLLWQTADYLRICRGMLSHLPKLQADEAIVFMGHGTEHPSNASYALLENTFRFSGAERTYVCTVEGFPNFDYALRRLHRHEVSRVYLAPFMIVAGDHAQNDLAGDGDGSWRSILESEGYGVNVLMEGLGTYPETAKIFLEHLPE